MCAPFSFTQISILPALVRASYRLNWSLSRCRMRQGSLPRPLWPEHPAHSVFGHEHSEQILVNIQSFTRINTHNQPQAQRRGTEIEAAVSSSRFHVHINVHYGHCICWCIIPVFSSVHPESTHTNQHHHYHDQCGPESSKMQAVRVTPSGHLLPLFFRGDTQGDSQAWNRPTWAASGFNHSFFLSLIYLTTFFFNFQICFQTRA